jgi:hypothetical protein
MRITTARHHVAVVPCPMPKIAEEGTLDGIDQGKPASQCPDRLETDRNSRALVHRSNPADVL